MIIDIEKASLDENYKPVRVIDLFPINGIDLNGLYTNDLNMIFEFMKENVKVNGMSFLTIAKKKRTNALSEDNDLEQFKKFFFEKAMMILLTKKLKLKIDTSSFELFKDNHISYVNFYIEFSNHIKKGYKSFYDYVMYAYCLDIADRNPFSYFISRCKAISMITFNFIFIEIVYKDKPMRFVSPYIISMTKESNSTSLIDFKTKLTYNNFDTIQDLLTEFHYFNPDYHIISGFEYNKGRWIY